MKKLFKRFFLLLAIIAKSARAQQCDAGDFYDTTSSTCAPCWKDADNIEVLSGQIYQGLVTSNADSSNCDVCVDNAQPDPENIAKCQCQPGFFEAYNSDYTTASASNYEMQGSMCMKCPANTFKGRVGTSMCTENALWSDSLGRNCADYHNALASMTNLWGFEDSLDQCCWRSAYIVDPKHVQKLARVYCNKFSAFVGGWGDSRIWDSATQLSQYACVSSSEMTWGTSRYSPNMYFHPNGRTEECQDSSHRFSRTGTMPSQWFDCPDANKCNYVVRFDDECKTIPKFAPGDFLYVPGNLYNYGDSSGSTSVTRWTQSQCAACPPNSMHSETGQSSIQACECAPGYTHTSSAEACEALAQTSGGAWTGCRGDAARVDHISGAACEESPLWETLSYGCTFDPISNEWNWNWEVSGTDTSLSKHCRECSPGTYKEDTGNGACVVCPENSMQNIKGSLSISDCKCNVIYENTAVSPGFTECQACRAGYFIEQASNLCVACRPGTITTVEGETSCTLCPDGMHSFRGESECFDKLQFLRATNCSCTDAS